MTTPPPSYRIEDLAQVSGTTVRTIRAYTDRGLMPRPERRGRANVYGEAHVVRLRQIADLLDRGYTLAGIKDLLEAWDAGRGLGGVLGLVAEVGGPWSDESPERIARAGLDAKFGGTQDDEAVADALRLGVLESVPGRDDEFLVPSPNLLDAAAQLHAAGVPVKAIAGHLRELRGQVEHIAGRFLEFTTEHVFARCLGNAGDAGDAGDTVYAGGTVDGTLSDADADAAARLVRRLRPLAQQTVNAELARAMRDLAIRHLGRRARRRAGRHGGGGALRPDDPETAAHVTVDLPAGVVERVRELVGAGETAAFIAAAAEREVQARALDSMVSHHLNAH